jgi:tRNA threonylcarbamoyladenosine biosynthesis protein TsaB
LIGFDTATEDTAVCATRDGEILHESRLGLSADGSPGHTTRLLEEVERAAEAAGGWDAVEGIAVGLGPGSFTGLRVGLASARALSASTSVPLTGVCTLDALAHGLAATGAAHRTRLAVIDARRGEVFAAHYSAAGERLWGPWVGSPSELGERLAELPEPPLAAGSGAVRFRDELEDRGADVPDDGDAVHRVAARDICALAAAGDTAGAGEALAPIYLRPPDAERWRERDNPKKTG